MLDLFTVIILLWLISLIFGNTNDNEELLQWRNKEVEG